MHYEVTTLYTKEQKEKMIALLNAQRIRLDKNIDYSCGIFNDNQEIIATGSYYQNTLRCLAIDERYQGEGLMNQIITHLVHQLYYQDVFHLFVYTKNESAHFFEQLGFHQLVQIENGITFLENKPKGFSQYLTTLNRYKKESGSKAALVMNCNPFTLGHQYLVETVAEKFDWVYLFLLEEDASVFPYTVRKNLVENGTAHLPNVMIVPTGHYIISQATFPGYFQKDEQSVIESQAMVDASIFMKIAQHLGITNRFVGEEPYSQMTQLYNRMMTKVFQSSPLNLTIIERKQDATNQAISASKVRMAIKDDDWAFVKNSVPATTFEYLNSPEATPIIAKIKAIADNQHH